MKNTAQKVLFICFLLLVVAGCTDTKSLPGNYKLQRWEDNKTYYLLGPSKNESDQGGGLIDGAVIRLAWSGEIIVAERFSTFRGDPDGWMVVEIKTGKISGPISIAEFDMIRKRYRLQVKEASNAWSTL
jgi:hypothetical protein